MLQQSYRLLKVTEDIDIILEDKVEVLWQDYCPMKVTAEIGRHSLNLCGNVIFRKAFFMFHPETETRHAVMIQRQIMDERVFMLRKQNT